LLTNKITISVGGTTRYVDFTMECGKLLVLFAVIFSVTAAPTGSEEILLQDALDNEVDQRKLKTDAAAESTGDQWVNLLGTALNLVKEYNQQKASNPSTKSAEVASDSFSKDGLSNTDIIDDTPHALPVSSPNSDRNGDTYPDIPKPKKTLCGRTDNPCTQRFLRRDVQDHYNKMVSKWIFFFNFFCFTISYLNINTV